MKRKYSICLCSLLVFVLSAFAVEQDDLSQKEADKLYQCIQSYYLKNTDSMRFYIQKAEPVFLEVGRMEDLFRVKAWLIYALTSEREDQAVLKEVEALKRLSDELAFPDGKEMANQALADFYIETGLRDEGIGLYEEVFQGMEKRDSPLMKRVNIIRHLLNKGGRADIREKYLKKLDTYIKDCERKGIEWLDKENSVGYVKFLYHRSYTQLALELHDVKSAKFHLDETVRLMKKENLKNQEVAIQGLNLKYNIQIKEYDKALSILNPLIDWAEKTNRTVGLIDFLRDKAEIHFRQGQGMEAVKVYQRYVALKDSVSSASYYADLAKLKSRHEVDKLELVNKQMALEAARSRAHLLVMGGGIAFLLLLCFTLGYISYSRHRYGRQLEKAKERAEEADRLKSAFLANMNHEIRTPLNAIVGFSQVLVDEDDHETRQQLADIIQSNNELLQRLVADVLDLSKIESNSMDLIYKQQDLPALMNEINQIILLRMSEGVELKLDTCLPILMETDRNRLTQILTNLLTNAIKHTPSGFIRFGYTLKDGMVEFFVQDTGEGIPEEQLDRIFSRFVQLDSWHKGVGLGLAICKGLIEQMGGKVWVTSKVGEGSIFYVALPQKHPVINN